MATNGRNRRLEPSYKQHTAVDDVKGVVVDVEVTTGEENEGMAVEAQLDAIAMTTGVAIKTATMDAGYAYAKVFGRWRTARSMPSYRPRPSGNLARSYRRGALGSMPSTTWCAVQLARSYGPRASCNGAPFNTSMRVAKTVGPVPSGLVA
ncbi:transposase [Bradyrhizobium sp. 157]|nr:transposase [Bradyrhizobium sp. 157]